MDTPVALQGSACSMISGVPGWDLGEVSELPWDREKPGHTMSKVCSCVIAVQGIGLPGFSFGE